MKRILILGLGILLGTHTLARAQGPPQQSGSFMGGIGYSSIDDESYFAFTLRPDIAIGKFGMGLNIELRYNTTTGAIRSVDYDESYDYARLIRYIRYGHKYDPTYAKIGTLDWVRLGHGLIVDYYTNEASYDNRKIGLVWDMDFDTWGFESMTSNLGRLEVVGGRLYYRPLRALTDIPIVKNFTLGGTFARDADPDSWRGTDDGVSVMGFDVGLPIIRTKIWHTELYFDFAQIADYGSGKSVGIETRIHNLGGLASVYARLERRFLGEQFVPSFFNAFYEVERFSAVSGDGVRKADMLPAITEETRGIFGELGGHVLNVIRLSGTFQRLDETPRSGIMHLQAEVPDAVPTLTAAAAYDKQGIETFEDVRTLDNRSVARVSVGYKIKPYLVMYMDYIWNFVYDESINSYTPQERVEPRLAFVYNFDM